MSEASIHIAIDRHPDNIVFGGLFNPHPFVPWPAYTEGHSKALEVAIDALKAGATHVPEPSKHA